MAGKQTAVAGWLDQLSAAIRDGSLELWPKADTSSAAISKGSVAGHCPSGQILHESGWQCSKFICIIIYIIYNIAVTAMTKLIKVRTASMVAV